MHDASRFPLVRLRRRAVKPGYAFAWRAEMQRLLALKTPFVIVSRTCADETADDTRLRAAWLRSQATSLARVLPWLHRDRAAHRSAGHDARSRGASDDARQRSAHCGRIEHARGGRTRAGAAQAFAASDPANDPLPPHHAPFRSRIGPSLSSTPWSNYAQEQFAA